MSASKQQSGECKKRLVIKNVLADPFNIDWPTLNPDVEKQVVAKLCEIVSPVGKYRSQNNLQTRTARKKQKDSETTEKIPERLTPPSVSNQFCFGLREILRGLGGTERTSVDSADSAFDLIFACHEDVEPPILLGDILSLATQKKVLICGLSKGTTQKLGLALGQSRVTCLGVKHGANEFSEITDLLAQNLTREIPLWDQLASIKNNSEMQHKYEPVLQKTRIKRLRTFAPILSKKKSKS